ncbi:MAG: hypothetical protein U0X39_07450 [Bacteroidales bacterium]
MNNKQEYADDPLAGYLSKGRPEKAPEGFTENIMYRISLEKAPARNESVISKKHMVPIIASLSVLILVVSAVFSSGSSQGLDSSVSRVIHDLLPGLSEFKPGPMVQLSLPAIVAYIMVGLLVLFIFDSALNRLFRKSRPR